MSISRHSITGTYALIRHFKDGRISVTYYKDVDPNIAENDLVNQMMEIPDMTYGYVVEVKARLANLSAIASMRASNNQHGR